MHVMMECTVLGWAYSEAQPGSLVPPTSSMGLRMRQSLGAAALGSPLPGYSPSLHIRWTVPLLLQ